MVEDCAAGVGVVISCLLGFWIMSAGHREGGVHGILRGGESGGLGAGAVGFEIFFAAAGEGGVCR